MSRTKRSHAARRYRFTRKDCQKGYRAALKVCMQDWDKYAWFYRKVRGFYRQREREAQEPPF